MVALGYCSLYLLTIPAVKAICNKISNNQNTKNILLYLNTLTNTEIIVREQPRKEYQFGKMLNQITGFNWSRQYTIPNKNGGVYRLDFKFNNNLIVEYDEKNHNYESLYSNEEKRIEYCIDWLAKNETNGYRIPYIRVKEGYELEGIHKIMMFLIKFDIYNKYYKEKLM